MAAWLSTLIASIGLTGLSKLSAGALDVKTVYSLRDITPQRGDLVVFDVDDTLIHPVHSAMQGAAGWARDWWRPMLPINYNKVMSLAWCQDGRQLVERTTHQTIREWRKLGVMTVALSARSRALPWGNDMASALCRQLAALGIHFKHDSVRDGCLKASGALACTDGCSKHSYILQTARVLGIQRPAKIWVIDDRPDAEWKGWSGEQSDPEVCIAHYVAARSGHIAAPRLYEILEMGYYLKTGRWPSHRFASGPRAAGLLARISGTGNPFRSS